MSHHVPENYSPLARLLVLGHIDRLAEFFGTSRSEVREAFSRKEIVIIGADLRRREIEKLR